MSSKSLDLERLAEVVSNGDSVSLGGAWLCNHPMAAVREIVRARRRNLHIISVIGSVDVDFLLAARAVDELTFSMVTLEAFGLAPNFRRDIENNIVAINEMTALSMEVGLEAAARNVPFMVFPGLGQPATTDLVERNPHLYAYVKDPFRQNDVLAVNAIRPDVAIVHALRADEEGNAQFDGTYGIDDVLAKAANTVIVTCEEIVDRETIVASPHMTKIPGFLVDHVIEAPYGAHPTSHVPRYVMDAPQLLEYTEAMNADEQLQKGYVDQIAEETESGYRTRILSGRSEVLEEMVRQARVLDGVMS